MGFRRISLELGLNSANIVHEDVTDVTWAVALALMSAGVKGILAVGTDLFHIFAKGIMGSVLHSKMGHVSVKLAFTFLIGALAGSYTGGTLNRAIYAKNPVLSDTFS